MMKAKKLIQAEMAYELIFAPTNTTLMEKVEALGSRWTVEHSLEEARVNIFRHN
jgi:hypothetical protein